MLYLPYLTHRKHTVVVTPCHTASRWLIFIWADCTVEIHSHSSS